MWDGSIVFGIRCGISRSYLPRVMIRSPPCDAEIPRFADFGGVIVVVKGMPSLTGSGKGMPRPPSEYQQPLSHSGQVLVVAAPCTSQPADRCTDHALPAMPQAIAAYGRVLVLWPSPRTHPLPKEGPCLVFAHNQSENPFTPCFERPVQVTAGGTAVQHPRVLRKE